jgi:hypothetical protein
MATASPRAATASTFCFTMPRLSTATPTPCVPGRLQKLPIALSIVTDNVAKVRSILGMVEHGNAVSAPRYRPNGVIVTFVQE